MSFVQRIVKIDLTLGGDGSSLQGKLSYSGLRTSVIIEVAGQHENKATANIYGLSLSHMNALTVVPFKPAMQGKNTIRISAGDAVSGMSQVFEGKIIQAWPDMQNAPEVPFRIDAQPGVYAGAKPVAATSFSGPTPVSKIFKAIAGKMDDFTPEDNGLKGVLNNPYFWGSANLQMSRLAAATRMGWVQENGIVAAWPMGGSRTSAGSALNVSKETGMVGYPYAVPGGIMVKTLFNKAIKYASTMNVKSDIEVANGTWTITRQVYELELLVPRGKWFASLFGVPVSSGSSGETPQ